MKKQASSLRRRFGAHPGSSFLRILILVGGGISTLICLGLIATVTVRGIPELRPELFAYKYNSENLSMLPAVLNTLEMTFLTLSIVLPIGIGTAIYLAEYAQQSSRLLSLIRTAIDTLQGIPSVLFGLLGYLLFVTLFGWGYSMLAGVFTLVLITLPLIIRTAEEAILAVPKSYREASYALGAGHLRTVFCTVLPAAFHGILGGVVLAIGRIVGETAALIFTAGTAVSSFTGNPMEAGRTLAVHLYSLWNEGLSTGEAYATAAVLLIFTMAINLLSDFLTKGMENKRAKQQ